MSVTVNLDLMFFHEVVGKKVIAVYQSGKNLFFRTSRAAK